MDNKTPEFIMISFTIFLSEIIFYHSTHQYYNRQKSIVYILIIFSFEKLFTNFTYIYVYCITNNINFVDETNFLFIHTYEKPIMHIKR